MMEIDTINNLQSIIKGAYFIDEPLSKHTTFSMGGKVNLWVEPHDKEDLKNIIKEISENNFTAANAPCLPRDTISAVLARHDVQSGRASVELKARNLTWSVIGNGSNILAGEKGLPDVVIKLVNFKALSIEGDTIKAESGVSLAKLTGFAIEHGLSGLEFLAGIPGLVGGAIKGNAGAHGNSVADVIKEINVMNLDGEIYYIPRDKINFKYRKSDIENNLIILGAVFNLVSGDKDEMQELVKKYLIKRKESYPFGPNAGSIFKNPPNAKAGEIIDRLGLKGFKIGNAMVSHQHANMIVNTGGAKMQDVAGLIKYIQNKVYAKTGIKLDPEIIIWGDPAPSI